MSAAIGHAPRVYFPSPRTNAPLTMPITAAERAFILLGLSDVSGVVDRILHGPAAPGGQMVPQWGRATMVQNAWRMIGGLRRGGRVMLVIGEAQRRLLIEAIEGNPYFVLPKNDPRLNAAAITQADALRLKAQALLGTKVRRFPVGLPAGAETDHQGAR